MRHLVITQNATVDGAIEMLGGWFAPQAEGADDLVAENRRHQNAADALLVGRMTFESFRDYWRDLENDTTGVRDYLNGVRKYVVSSTLTDPDWEHTTVLSGDVIAEINALKKVDGKDIVCTGSITLTHALITTGLVDEYRLFVYPVVQGVGRRLFPDGHQAQLELAQTKQFANGVGLLRYRNRS